MQKIFPLLIFYYYRTYVKCYLSTINVCVPEPKVSMNITSSDRTVIEGDTVSITCDSDPSPDKYILLSSLVGQ